MSKKPAALDIKSANLYALRVVLREAGIARLSEALDARMAEAGSLFENEPVIIDTAHLSDDAVLDWAALGQALRGYKLWPIGVVAEGGLRESAVQAGLTPLELSAPTSRPAARSSSPAADDPGAAASAITPTPTTPAPSSSLIVSRPLRSGQRVYAREGDLVVIGMVSQGAEVIADGNIHVYGPLRGKAMAGARGNAAARIFTTHLDPELLAIAGIYRVVENRLAPSLRELPAQVWLENGALEIKTL